MNKIEDETKEIVMGARYSPVPARISYLVSNSPLTRTVQIKIIKSDIKYADMGSIEDHIVKLFNMTCIHLRSSYAFLTLIFEHTGGQNILQFSK